MQVSEILVIGVDIIGKGYPKAVELEPVELLVEGLRRFQMQRIAQGVPKDFFKYASSGIPLRRPRLVRKKPAAALVQIILQAR